MINQILFASNPFIDAYTQSDIIGKFIFVSLIALSIVSWIILIKKFIEARGVQNSSAEFQRAFALQKLNPLSLETENKKDFDTPFSYIYLTIKKNTLEILNKNKHFIKSESPFLSSSDIAFVEGHLNSTISSQVKNLDKNLFILATIVSLGPFLGLLGTVWGILTTFSHMQTQTSASSSQAILGGLSLALATTVLGLLDAIPALIGYNYLKNRFREFETDMELFAHEVLSSVEMQYRKVD